MEDLPWIPESEHLFGNNNLLDTSESSNTKRKVESLFCIMTKRTCRHNNSVDFDMCPDFHNTASDFRFENLMDNPYDPLDEASIEGSDTDLSESSEFDVISELVLEDNDLVTGSKYLSTWPTEEDDESLVSKWSSETLNPILFLSPYEEIGVRSKEDEVLSSVSASPKDSQLIIDPLICSGRSNNISLFHSELRNDPCNSDIFKNDGDKSSTIGDRYGDVLHMEGSMEIICINDELTLRIRDDEPVPISVVPPDSWSSILLETCSPYQINSCMKEYNNPDDNIGLEVSPISLTKTLERPSRPLSVCGSRVAVRNVHLMEDSSSDKKLYVNVSSSEDSDAELAQTPSTLYQEEVDGEDEICFSDIDAMISKWNLFPDDSDSYLNREEWNTYKHPEHSLLILEHCASTSMQRAIMFHGAIAVIHCRDSKHFIRKNEVIIGRSSDGLNVDINLAKYNFGSKISRRQASVKLENDGSFSLKNLGKQHILVNEEKLDAGQIVTLTSSSSSIDIRGIAFVFKINKEAVRQFLKNNTRRKSEDDTKFRWFE